LAFLALPDWCHDRCQGVIQPTLRAASRKGKEVVLKNLYTAIGSWHRVTLSRRAHSAGETASDTDVVDEKCFLAGHFACKETKSQVQESSTLASPRWSAKPCPHPVGVVSATSLTLPRNTPPNRRALLARLPLALGHVPVVRLASGNHSQQSTVS